MADVSQEIALPSRPRVLVAVDNVVTSRAIEHYLPHCELAVCDTATAAVEHLAFDHDVLLLDAELQEGDRVIDLARTRPHRMPILMIGGELTRLCRTGRPTQRPDDMIAIPFSREALITKLEHVLFTHARNEQAQRQRRQLVEMRERRERDLDVARTIFDRMFARGEFDRSTIRHLVVPADQFAGDVVFGAWAGAGRYRWMIGDVTGHTLSSALITMLLADAFYHLTRDGEQMEPLLRRLERKMRGVLPNNMFCAGAMCELDRGRGELHLWNGGNPDIVIRHAGGAVTRIASTGIPLAADRFSEPSHPIVTHPVGPGDRIFAFSDGLVEVRDHRGEMLGFDRLLNVVQSGDPATVFHRLVGCVPEYTSMLGYDDDISVVEVIV